MTARATEVGLFPAKVALGSSSSEAHGIEGCVRTASPTSLRVLWEQGLFPVHIPTNSRAHFPN